MTIVEPPDTTRLHWDISHVWITVNGNWDDVPDFAKLFQNDNLGGATHGFVLGFGLDGQRRQDEKLFLQGWPGNYALFSPHKEHDWWGNCLCTAGYNWAETTGPYYLQANAVSSAKLCGVGLPFPPLPWQPGGAHAEGGVHVSTFVVMQEVAPYEPDPDPDPVDPDLEPVLERYLRVLDKAEACADELAKGFPDMAGDIYVRIAKVLSM
jgi:hypothetical protein